METYTLRVRNKGPLTLSDTNNAESDPSEVFIQKQNAAAAEVLQRDFETFYYACSHCPRILMSLPKLRAHENAFHPGSRPSSHTVTRPPTQRPSMPHSNGEVKKRPSTSQENGVAVKMPKLVPQIPARKIKRAESGGFKVRTAGGGLKRRGLKKGPRRGLLNAQGEYSCKYCQTTFASPWNLKVHLQTIHENVRPFTCPTCGKGFKQRIHLLGHSISTHSNYKPFKCELCSVAFSKKWNLFDHVRKHHKGTKADLERLKFKYSKRKKGGEMDE